jgi:hypothetical protein
MRRTWTIVGVSDVSVSFKWYQSLLGLPQTTPAHEDFGQILDSYWSRRLQASRIGKNP